MKRRKVILIFSLMVFLFVSCIDKKANGGSSIDSSIKDDDNNDLGVHLDISKEKDESISNLNMVVVELKNELNVKNKYYFDDQVLKNDEIILLIDEASGLRLKKDDLVLVDFNIDPDISKQTKIGYFFDNVFTKIPYKLEANKLKAAIRIPKDGDYTICIMNSNDSTAITNGNLIIK